MYERLTMFKNIHQKVNSCDSVRELRDADDLENTLDTVELHKANESLHILRAV